MHYGERTLPAFTFHLSRHGANLLGLDLFHNLGFTLLDTTGSEIRTVATLWQQQWPALFEGLGCATAFSHQPLVDPNVTPVVQPLPHSPLALRDDITAELKRMLDDDIIEQVNASPWISNLVVIKKKTCGLCICVDLRAVNKAIISDRYPLPTTEELTAPHGSSVVLMGQQFFLNWIFAKDTFKCYYILIAATLPPSLPKTGCYKRMAFGLSSAPSCFKKIMASILAGIPGVAIYLDDIVVHGINAVYHDERLQTVLTALAENHLTLNTDKCVFAASVIDYVGFRLSAGGISPFQSNTLSNAYLSQRHQRKLPPPWA